MKTPPRKRKTSYSSLRRIAQGMRLNGLLIGQKKTKAIDWGKDQGVEILPPPPAKETE